MSNHLGAQSSFDPGRGGCTGDDDTVDDNVGSTLTQIN